MAVVCSPFHGFVIVCLFKKGYKPAHYLNESLNITRDQFGFVRADSAIVLNEDKPIVFSTVQGHNALWTYNSSLKTIDNQGNLFKI